MVEYDDAQLDLADATCHPYTRVYLRLTTEAWFFLMSKVEGVDRKLNDTSRSSSLGPHGLSFQRLRLVHRKPRP